MRSVWVGAEAKHQELLVRVGFAPGCVPHFPHAVPHLDVIDARHVA